MMASIELKLKPCPFCGGEAHVERYGNPRQSTIYACLECGCRLETGEEWGYTDWNERKESKDSKANIDGSQISGQ